MSRWEQSQAASRPLRRNRIKPHQIQPRCHVCRRSLNPACDTGHVCVDCEGKGLSRKTGSILDALKECYEAGGKAWDNPDVTLREIREG